MRIVVTLDKERTAVEIAEDGAAASWPGGSAPVKVVSVAGRTAELEIGGERVVVEGWPEYLPDAPAEIVVNGETFRLALERSGSAPPPIAAAPAPSGPTAPGPRAPTGPGTAIAPPMPGKVVELRVREGDTVRAGQVVLVLEAMKMRNEVTSPLAGVVRGLTVAAGSNVRARETMLRIVPP